MLTDIQADQIIRPFPHKLPPAAVLVSCVPKMVLEQTMCLLKSAKFTWLQIAGRHSDPEHSW